jgi:hypothetical protein
MSSLERFVTRRGKRIEVEILPLKGRPNKTRQRESELFAKVPLQWGAAAAKATRSHQAFVWIWLLHLAWKTRNTTFTLSNTALVRYGISREIKRKALAALTQSGLIKVERLPGRATVVTLLDA